LTNSGIVKTLTAGNTAILLKPHRSGFGGASAFSATVFVSPFVGAGSSTTGATPLSPPPGASGAPGFFEQLRRATAKTGNFDSEAKTPLLASAVVNAVLGNELPAMIPANVPPAVVKPAKPRGKSDSSGELSSIDSDIAVASVSPIPPAVNALTAKSISSSLPVLPRATQRRAFPGDVSGTVAELHTPVSGLPSDQSTGFRSLVPQQVPASNSDSALASRIPPALFETEDVVTSASPIQFLTVTNPVVGQLAFAARIKPEGSVVSSQGHTSSEVSSVAHDIPSSQIVKSAREASRKDGEPSHDEPENPAASMSNSVTPAAKSSFRRDGADSAEQDGVTNPVQPNGLLIPQLVNTSVPGEPALQTSAVAVPSAAAPEPTHVSLDKPAQAASPARNISLQVEGESGQTVDIRIAARSGDLSVAVRSGDGAMAQDLRQGLGDLESRLAQSGYHAETWHPGHNGLPTEPAAPGGNTSNSSSQQQSQSGSGWSQQNRGQRDPNPSNRPRWVNQLASTFKAESTEKGNANGIVT
jgi:hypothetical protein